MPDDRAKRIFLEALELDPKSRDAFIQACTDDGAIQSKILQLLAAHNSAGHFLSDPSISLERQTKASPGGFAGQE